MKKYIFRVVSKLGFALICLALKSSLKHDDLDHFEIFSSLEKDILSLNEIIQQDYFVVTDQYGDVTKFQNQYFPRAVKQKKQR